MGEYGTSSALFNRLVQYLLLTYTSVVVIILQAAEDGKSKEEAMQAYVDLAKELVGKPVEDVLAEQIKDRWVYT